MLADGEVTFEEYEAAIATSLSCLEDAGFDVIGPTHNDRQGFTLIDYSYSEFAPGMTREQGSAVADACLDEHSTMVEVAYQLGPIAVEGRASSLKTSVSPSSRALSSTAGTSLTMRRGTRSSRLQ